LVGQPSILERRQAVSDMATLNARRSSDYNRVYRQARRASRQGDMEAGLLALELGDLASKEGVELGGIRRYGQRMNAAGQDLSQRIQTNQELADMEGGEQPAASGAMTLTAQGWTPNETLATDPVQAQEGIVGGPSGIDATPIRSGPSPAEGGIMAARNRSVSPIYSSRGIEQQTTPQSLDPNYGPPVGSASTPDREFAKKFPALSAFMQRAGEVKDYTLSVPAAGMGPKDVYPEVNGDGVIDATEDAAITRWSNNIKASMEQDAIESEVASYRFDESLYPEEKKRRMAKRAKSERVDLSLSERSKQLRAGSGAPGTRVIVKGPTF
jgi:hypothetical protein